MKRSKEQQDKQKEYHDHAWNLLEEKGLTLGQRMKVRSSFVEWSGYREEYPFIATEYSKGDIQFYKSEIPELKNMGFESENHVILANAIYENTKENFNINQFRYDFEYTLKILGK